MTERSQHMTKLTMHIHDYQQSLQDTLKALPEYMVDSFESYDEKKWYGEFIITSPEAPELADGDLVDDLAPFFPQLLEIKKSCDVDFELHIAVGNPASDFFMIEPNIVSLLAALSAKIVITNKSM